MKRFLITIVCMSLFTCIFAQNFIQGGVSYRINPNQKDVMVVASENGYDGKVVIPATVTNDGKTYKVTHIGAKAFKKSGITSITLPEGLIEIGEDAFYQCQDLKTVTIPSTVVNIEKEAFIFCFSLNQLVFKAKIRPLIGDYAFGQTQVKLSGIETGIPANMAVPDKDSRYKINKSGGYVVY